MIFAGLLKDLGKVVIGNIIKNAGQEIVSHGTKKGKKDIAFDKFFLAAVNLKKESNNKINITNEKNEKIKNYSKIIKKLKELKIEIIKKKLPEKSKVKILEKIDKIIEILSKFNNETFQPPILANLDFNNNFIHFSNKDNLEFLNIKNLSQEFAELKKLLTLAFSQKNIFKSNENLLSKNLNKRIKHNNHNNFNKEIVANNFKKLSEINSNKYVENVSIKQTKVKNNEDFLKTAKLILKHLKNKKFNKDIFNDKFKELNEINDMKNNISLEKDKPEPIKFEIVENFKIKKDNFNKKDNLNSAFQKFSNLSNNSSKIKLKNIDNENVISKKMDFESKIIEQIKAKFDNNIKNEMTIKLHPPELGKIHIKLVALNHELTAKITTENHLVKNAIINNFQTLQDSLHEKGINLSNFQVNVQGEFAENNEKKQNKFEKFKNSFISVNNEDENEEYFEILNLIDEITNNLNLKA